MKLNESEKRSHDTNPTSSSRPQTVAEKKSLETKSDSRRTIFYTALAQTVLPEQVAATAQGGISPISSK